jgi:aspartyl-tRNA synthetase
MPEFLVDLKRTHDCGALRASDAGQRVVLFGWVAARRDHGGCVFIDLRDRGGTTQVVFEPQTNTEAHQQAGELRREYCIAIAGTVAERGGHKNPNMATGDVEVKADAITIFSTAETPPFELSDDTKADETIRLKHRYLDLRRPALQRNFIARSQIYQTTRRYLADNRFLEIETPFMV